MAALGSYWVPSNSPAPVVGPSTTLARVPKQGDPIRLHSTNPPLGECSHSPADQWIERLNKEVKRHADVVGIFPNQASMMRLIGAVLFAQIDEDEIDPSFSIPTKAV